MDKKKMYNDELFTKLKAALWKLQSQFANDGKIEVISVLNECHIPRNGSNIIKELDFTKDITDEVVERAYIHMKAAFKKPGVKVGPRKPKVKDFTPRHKAADERFANFSDRELMDELRARGWYGDIECTCKATI